MDKTILTNAKTMFKCNHCASYLTLEEELEKSNVIHFNKKYYHRDCLKSKMLKKKGNKLSPEDVDIIVEDLFKDSLNIIEFTIYKNHLHIYLMEHYNVISLPDALYTKLGDIYTGSYKRMSMGIPPNHLLDMFRRKAGYLDRMYCKAKMDSIPRINYDLAVLISQYIAYLDWIKKNKIENQMIVEKSKEELPDMEFISSRKEEVKQEEDIFSDIED